MSDFTAIRAVTLTLQNMLREHITNSTDPLLAGVPIDLRSPREMRDDNGAMGVSLWLYQVTRNGHTLNLPPQRLTSDQIRPHPLPVDLSYLVTPITARPADEHALLGRALQILNDHSVIRGSDLKGALEASSEELRLTLQPLTLEELTRVWDALKEPYQLSVCYLVQLVTIDSDHEAIQTSPVLVKKTQYEQILEVT